MRMCTSKKRVASTCMCRTRTLARELNTGKRARTIGCNRARSPELKAMRRKLRSRAGRRVYERRKTLVEPVFGVLKQQRGMRQFRTRGQAKVAAEFALAALLTTLPGCSPVNWHCKADQPREAGEIEKRNRPAGQQQAGSHAHTTGLSLAHACSAASGNRAGRCST